ncbi:tRNA-dihydrouridine(16/17) synthase [NAD(P)(+)] [Zancudomyces culisetae]|uniref:tRNA-dihydrouridine(16/17) synthase [NAD(P)(+)] n=1 Tax=Zancudomyces culisetae TaxID=1213189 RepID=A0A1R1PDT3_ZANCU|nr:tRNA-dihydrouridine(16/17) synthase [NAD(P)(+)] [Zancudomyces culisetae]OMH82725.1 tRNA-dihydrouridine(16/17) synthase [NAD(P)(+)] [Zancudomyces culisetae]|eukprot:OMH79137.1 tRNA-dihydrouridine(16/17) synthase [NAD(P)(+)] [Zancudomyces culisetae]
MKRENTELTETIEKKAKVETDTQEEMGAYDYFNKVLKSPKYILAPMVDQSELAWRMLSRKYGAHVCFTPMFHSKLFTTKQYFEDMWEYDEKDRPLIAQFCGNDPKYLVEASKLIEDKVDGIDLNLGCPQHIAKRGKYGSFLMEEWDLITQIITALCANIKVPISAKIRVFETEEKTVEYAKTLEKAGVKMLTVHGRLREQKGHKTGLCDWTKIRAVKRALKIPVVANGGIMYNEDIDKCLEFTECDAVMVAEGSLYNPAIFCEKDEHVNQWEIAQEYLQIVKENYPGTKSGYIKSHLFKIFKPSLGQFVNTREQLGKAKSLEDFENVVSQMKSNLTGLKDSSGVEQNGTNYHIDEYGYRTLPVWKCQPEIRKCFDSKNSTNGLPLGRKHFGSD